MHPLDVFYEAAELQRVAEDRNVRVAVVDDFRGAMSEGMAEEWDGWAACERARWR
jgi:hypothetical protein